MIIPDTSFMVSLRLEQLAQLGSSGGGLTGAWGRELLYI